MKIDRARFYSELRAGNLFGTKLSADQVRGMEGKFAAFDQVGNGRLDDFAYGLATSYHETGRRMLPVREGFASTDNGARKAVLALARDRGPKSAVAKYAQPAGPYGHVYYGRGDAQLTWHDNYVRMGKRLGLDLEREPDLMLDPKVSAMALYVGLLEGWWGKPGQGLRYYAERDGDPTMDHDDAVEARRTVNGTDKAELIAGYHAQFLAALEVARIPDLPPAPIPRPNLLGRLISWVR